MSATITDSIIANAKAHTLVSHLRPMLPTLSDSDRFMLFGVIMEGYCRECGCDLKGELDCSGCVVNRQ